MASGRRVHERFELVLPVTVIHTGGQTTGTTRNVSLGGALIGVDGSVAFGEVVQVKLALAPLREDATVTGTVRWVTDGAIGVQFGSLRAKEVWALNQMFKDAPVI